MLSSLTETAELPREARFIAGKAPPSASAAAIEPAVAIAPQAKAGLLPLDAEMASVRHVKMCSAVAGQVRRAPTCPSVARQCVPCVPGCCATMRHAWVMCDKRSVRLHARMLCDTAFPS